jgi:hypothetical protein
MNLIKSYENFLDFLLEEYLKLDVPLYYTKELKSTLGAIASKGDPVGSFLYYGESTDAVKSDITLVGLGQGNDKVSFIQVNRLLRMIDKDLGDPESKNQGLYGQKEEDYINKIFRIKNNFDHPAWKEQRTELGVGRFATKISQKAGKNFTPVQINTFVDKFKAYMDFQTTKKEKFEVVQGEEIRKWYDEDTYEDPEYHLNNSCMRYERCQDYLDIYVENPNQVTMVIMKGTDPNKIIGRALIWRLKDETYYLDRPYANNDEDINLFKEWGRSKGYSVYGADYKHKEVVLDKAEFSSYPYMDTFKYLNRDEKLLSTGANQFDDGDQNWIRLESTGGGYEEAQTGVWSDYEGEYIDEEDAVFCQDIQDYTYSDNSYYLEYLDQYYTDRADVVYSEYDSSYYLEEDAVHSDYGSDWIYANDAMEAYYSSEDQTWVPDNFMTRGLADEYFIENKVKICLSACVFKSPFADEYLFRNGTLLVYKLEDGSMVTEQEAEEKEIDLKGIESEYVDLDDYMSKVEKITQADLLTKLKEYNFAGIQITKFRDTVSLRGGFRSDLRTFFGETNNEPMAGLIKMLIYFSYKESEKNEFGKVRRKNRREVLDNSESTVNEFIEKIKINNLSTSTLELMFELVDAQISNLISDKNFLSQIIMLKSTT